MGIVAKCDTSLIKCRVDDVSTFDYESFYRIPLLKHGKNESRNQRKNDYLNCIMTLDIETTRLDYIKQSILYIWQVCLNGHSVIGRSLPELKIFLDKLCLYSDNRTKIMCFIHNLSFEFHHLRQIIHFEEVFSVDKRRPVKALYKNIEFRCSYILTNSSLDAFLKKMKVETLKTSMDYTKLRYSWSKLNAKETQYCLHDVIGLYEGIKKQLEIEGDTLYTIPLTSTGYTRRDVKKAYYKESRKKKFQDAIPSYEVFEELREAFRGGNTHANRWISGKLIESCDYGLIHSWDRASSYPDVLLKQNYPWKFEKADISVDYAISLGKAVLFRAILTDVKLKNRFDGCPYIPVSKCRNLSIVRVEDNGRILSADSLTITLTDQDYLIIRDQYSFNMETFDVYISDYEPLPGQIKKVILKYFYGKCTLKGDESTENEYMKFKNRFNAVYGLMVQSPAKLNIDYLEDSENIFDYRKDETLEEIYYKNCKKIFLQYAWGVWCTTWARVELQKIIKIVQNTPDAMFLYTDTDSVKFTGEVDFSDYNKLHTQLSKECGAYAKDIKGNTHFIGVLEQESDMLNFCTHGAKKYAYTDTSGKLHLTCAGVNKKKGAEELYSINWFKDGFIFGEAAGLEAKYNDFPNINHITINGHYQKIYSNIYLSDSTYTLSKTGKYKELLDRLEYIML